MLVHFCVVVDNLEVRLQDVLIDLIDPELYHSMSTGFILFLSSVIKIFSGEWVLKLNRYNK